MENRGNIESLSCLHEDGYGQKTYDQLKCGIFKTGNALCFFVKDNHKSIHGS